VRAWERPRLGRGSRLRPCSTSSGRQAGRSGAIAGRGYHFQDVVGMWLAARSLAGRLMVEQIVPEGLEDLSCEGADAWHVQVK